MYQPSSIPYTRTNAPVPPPRLSRDGNRKGGKARSSSDSIQSSASLSPSNSSHGDCSHRTCVTGLVNTSFVLNNESHHNSGPDKTCHSTQNNGLIGSSHVNTINSKSPGTGMSVNCSSNSSSDYQKRVCLPGEISNEQFLSVSSSMNPVLIQAPVSCYASGKPANEIRHSSSTEDSSQPVLLDATRSVSTNRTDFESSLGDLDESWVLVSYGFKTQSDSNNNSKSLLRKFSSTQASAGDQSNVCSQQNTTDSVKCGSYQSQSNDSLLSNRPPNCNTLVQQYSCNTANLNRPCNFPQNFNSPLYQYAGEKLCENKNLLVAFAAGFEEYPNSANGNDALLYTSTGEVTFSGPNVSSNPQMDVPPGHKIIGNTPGITQQNGNDALGLFYMLPNSANATPERLPGCLISNTPAIRQNGNHLGSYHLHTHSTVATPKGLCGYLGPSHLSTSPCSELNNIPHKPQPPMDHLMVNSLLSATSRDWVMGRSHSPVARSPNWAGDEKSHEAGFIKTYQQKQNFQLETLQYHHDNRLKVLESLRQEVTDLETRVRLLRREKNDLFPTTEDVQKLGDENRTLLIDVEQLTRLIDIANNGQAPLGVLDPAASDCFYANIPMGQRGSLNTYTPPPPQLPPRIARGPSSSQMIQSVTRPPPPPPPPYQQPLPGPPGPTSTQPVEGPLAMSLNDLPPWECSGCTFHNHPALQHCEFCDYPRTPIVAGCVVANTSHL